MAVVKGLTTLCAGPSLPLIFHRPLVLSLFSLVSLPLTPFLVCSAVKNVTLFNPLRCTK